MIQELPFEYNFPLHLLQETPDEYKPSDLSTLVTVRYENIKILKKSVFNEPHNSWISQQLQEQT